MARAPGGARRRGGRRAAAGGGEAVRKGPWTAEEDEMLLEHVRVHGPRDWSSIRSKGLLPRTGKSCRLRWVNKLRPNLKTGCKFTPEEERVVIELQAQFGNKWARIATYLPGRTDNDVKNFWSTRQKRLARLLRTPPARSSKNSNSIKAPASSPKSRPTMGPRLEQVPSVGNSSGGQCCTAALLMEYQDAARILHDQTGSGFLSFDGPLPLTLQIAPNTDGEASSSSAAQLAPELPCDQPPYHLLGFTGLQEVCDIGPGFVEDNAVDDLAYQELLPIVQPAPMMTPFFGMECAHDAVKVEPRDAAAGCSSYSAAAPVAHVPFLGAGDPAPMINPAGLVDVASLHDGVAYLETKPEVQPAQFFGLEEDEYGHVAPARQDMPDVLFDDLPPEMFDFFELPPPSPPLPPHSPSTGMQD